MHIDYIKISCRKIGQARPVIIGRELPVNKDERVSQMWMFAVDFCLRGIDIPACRDDRVCIMPGMSASFAD